MSIYLGKPNCKVETWCKEHIASFDGDVFTKYDGTTIKIPYDASKTHININTIEHKDEIRQFDFGKSYTSISSLTYYDNQHGISLSRTSIKNGFDITLAYNELTSFALPENITNFRSVVLNGNTLSSFSLPNSICSFDTLNLGGNALSSFEFPNDITSFNNVSFYNNMLTSLTLPVNLQIISTSLQIDKNRLFSIILPRQLSEINRLILDNECEIDATQFHTEDEVPTISYIKASAGKNYTGKIYILSGLLACFEEKWRPGLNYQEV